MRLSIECENIYASLSKFEDYLRSHGCELQPKSNEYELIRFKSALGVGVIYTGGKGLSCNVPFVSDALNLFFANQPWEPGKIAPRYRRYPSPKRKKELLARDGDSCFYCGNLLKEDITEEHLVSVSQHGYSRLDNMVLAHFKCNDRASHKSLMEKIQLRDEMKWGAH